MSELIGEKPAFPAMGWSDGKYSTAPSGGMNLRTYLAAKFAAAWISALCLDTSGEPIFDVIQEANKKAIAQADDLIKRLEGKA